MGIVNNPKNSVRFVPAAQITRPEDEQTAYYLRVPAVADRAAFRRAVTAAGGRAHSEFDLVACMADGVRSILTDPDDADTRDVLLAELEDMRQRMLDFNARVRSGELSFQRDPDELTRAYAEAFKPSPVVGQAEDTIIRHYQRYADMCADRTVYGEIRGTVAGRMFLVGWENVTGADGKQATFRRRGDGQVPDSVLSLVSTAHLIEIGARVEELLEPTETKLKN